MAEATDVNQGQLRNFLEAGGVTELLVKTGDGVKETPLADCEFLNKHCGLYFSAHWCGPCRSFTPQLAKKYAELQEKGMTIIFNSWDQDTKAFDDYYGEMPWVAIPFKYKDALKKVREFKQPQGIPSLYLFNEKGDLYQKSGRAAVMNKEFPYENPSLQDVLGIVRDGEGNKVDAATLQGKMLFFYFSASWCGPCQNFTPKLATIYNKQCEAKADGKDFEIIFVSSDRDDASFEAYFKKMPWLALDKSSAKFDEFRSFLRGEYGVRGIPHLGSMSAEGEIIKQNCTGNARSDTNGDDFPWLPKPYYDLSEETDGLNEMKCIILMMGSTDEAKQAEHIGYMSPHATEQLALEGKRECMHFTGKKDAELTKRIREVAPFEGDKMILLDVQDKSYYVTALPESAEDVTNFWKDHGEKNTLKL